MNYQIMLIGLKNLKIRDSELHGFNSILVYNGSYSQKIFQNEIYDNQIWDRSNLSIDFATRKVEFSNCCLIINNYAKEIIILKAH